MVSDAKSKEPRPLLGLGLVLAVTAGVFVRSLAGDFVYDDLLLVERNPEITSLTNVPSLLVRPYWGFLDASQAEQIGYWRPVSAVLHAVAWSLGDGRAFAFHAVSLAAHLVATAIVFLFARRLLRGTTWIATGAALLFGLHPAHVESVAWISALNDPLVGLFAIAALDAHLRWRQRGSSGVPVLPAVFLFLGLCSKEVAVAILPLCAVLDLVRALSGEGSVRRASDWRPYVPQLVAVGLWIVLRILVFRSPWAGFERAATHFGVDAMRLLLLRVELLGGGLELLAWPVHLSTFRTFDPNLAWTSAKALLALASITAALGVGIALVRWRAYEALFALLIVPTAFFPVLVSVGSLGRFPLSDRFLYTSVLGFALLLVIAARRFARLGVVFVLAVGSLYGWRSYERIGVWQDEETFFTSATRESPRSVYVAWGMGRVWLEKLAETDDERYLRAAFAEFERAADLLTEAKQDPGSDLFVTSADFLQTNLGLAQCYMFEASHDEYGGYETSITILEGLARRVGELRDEAREAREAGLRVIAPHLELELVYAALGTAYRAAGDLASAESAYRKALALDRRSFEAQMGLGRIYAERGEWQAAIKGFEYAVGIAPGDFEARLALAQSLRESGRTQRAEELAEALIAERPDLPQPYLILAANRLQAHRERDALVWIDRAIQADQESGQAWYLKGLALQSLEVNETAALEALSRAASLLPDEFNAQYSLGALLLQRGSVDAARPYLIRAYALAPDTVQIGRLYTVMLQEGFRFESAQELYDLAAADGRRGRDDVAESWLDRALAMDPDHPDALLQKAQLLARQGRREEGLVLMRRAAEVLPGNLAAQYELARYLETMERYGEAREQLEHCLTLERPESWSEEDWERAREGVRQALARVAELAPPPAVIGPPGGG